MSNRIKLGPPWDRVVIDPTHKVIKHRMRNVARFDDLKRLRVRELITPFEEEQLLNLHPEVQKDRRPAELWVDRKDGQSLKVAEVEQAGLLLAALAEVASELKVPIEAERVALTPRA